jgi:hypothetical protein
MILFHGSNQEVSEPRLVKQTRGLDFGEAYKDEKGLTGREAYSYLLKTGAIRYILDCWDGLHMTGTQYVIDSIDEYISTHAHQ